MDNNRVDPEILNCLSGVVVNGNWELTNAGVLLLQKLGVISGKNTEENDNG